MRWRGVQQSAHLRVHLARVSLLATQLSPDLLFAGGLICVCVFGPNLARFSAIMGSMNRVEWFKSEKSKVLQVPKKERISD